MAELAAKIRAKFRRRHSAVPGLPSLLSRTSVRSSDSHASSSLFRPGSLSQSVSSTTHAGDADHLHDHDLGGANSSASPRLGSSRGGSVLDASASADAWTAHNDDPQPPAGDAVLPVLPELPVLPIVAETTGPGQLPLKSDLPVELELQLEAAENPGHLHHNVKDHLDQFDHLDDCRHRSHPVIIPDAKSDATETSISQPTPDHGNLSADNAALYTATVAAAAAASTTSTKDQVAAPALTATAFTATALPASALPALAIALPSTAIPAMGTAASTAASTLTSPNLLPMSPPAGKDRQPPLRKLSIVDEQPSPDNLIDDPTHPQPHPQQPQAALAPAPDIQQQDLHSVSPGITAAAAASPRSPNTTRRERDDAKLHAAAVPVQLLTPQLAQGPPTPSSASSPSRPRHIHLPPASFGGPNPTLSPGPLHSALSSTAPTSPLRHSTLAPSATRPLAPVRRQSLLSNRQSTLIHTLLGRSSSSHPEDHTNGLNTLNSEHLLPIDGNMVTRKIWVKRPDASATLVTINEDDLVDDVREMILRKYANSLGRQFDAPDLTLRIRPTGNQQERTLGPEEPMSRTLDAYFPSGQTIDDALIIHVPLRRTPRASPRVGPPHAPQIQYYVEDPRPPETANDYFGPGALQALPVTVTAPSAGSGHSHAISVLNTGQVPQIPSPGGGRRARDYRERPERPRLGRQHTSSPTLINLASGTAMQGSSIAAGAVAAVAPHGMHTTSSHTRITRSRTHSETSDASQAAPQQPAAAVPTPPPAEPASAVPQAIATPPARVASPRPKKSKKKTDHPMLPKGMLNGSVPPINVLIVEDNIINLKLLEAFVKRLKVRWSTAMNGRDAVLKWRNGGFHLVLMDIQLPIMSGLDATREIRRLERVNSIGVFSSAASSAPEEVKGEPDEKDKLENKDLFKSPVIIVALTASSLQSDRHEALAAGCNDFLTKPVNFVWLERKVMEWGCMQALIDFDGWRKWKDFSSQQVDDRAKAAAALKAKSKKNRSSLTQAVTAGFD